MYPLAVDRRRIIVGYGMVAISLLFLYQVVGWTLFSAMFTAIKLWTSPTSWAGRVSRYCLKWFPPRGW